MNGDDEADRRITLSDKERDAAIVKHELTIRKLGLDVWRVSRLGLLKHRCLDAVEECLPVLEEAMLEFAAARNQLGAKQMVHRAWIDAEMWIQRIEQMTNMLNDFSYQMDREDRE